MIKYRTYVDLGKGYESYGTNNVEKTVKLLEHIVNIRRKNKKILVVECDYVNNLEFPVFLAVGNDMDDYLYFKDKILQENNVKCLKKN